MVSSWRRCRPWTYQDIYVALFRTDGTAEVFDIDAVQDHQGDAQLDVYAEEEAFDEEDGNGAVSREDVVSSPDAAEAAVDAFLDFCERRGITEEEKDLIWNAMAFLCYEQVQNRMAPFTRRYDRSSLRARHEGGRRDGRSIGVGTKCRTPAYLWQHRYREAIRLSSASDASPKSLGHHV